MIHRLQSLFQRYLSARTILKRPGPRILGSNGSPVANVEMLGLHGGRLIVQGWALADLVELRSETSHASVRPNLQRQDVNNALSLEPNVATGFEIDLPYFGGHSILTFYIDGEKHVATIEPFPDKQLRFARFQEFAGFLAKLTRALPLALRWRYSRDHLVANKIKKILELDLAGHSHEISDHILDDPNPTPKPAPVTIILPVYNAFDLLQECLDRLSQLSNSPYHLLIVEDGSTDPRIKPFLKDWMSSKPENNKIELIENAENLGFIKSVNKGFERALELGNHVILLNSDAFVPKDWIARLIAPITSDATVASVTPMSNDAEIFSVPSICQRSDLPSGTVDLIDAQAMRIDGSALGTVVPTGVGFCMAINLAYLKKIPTLDTSFGRGYGEEVDWCQKIRKLGGRHVAQPNLFVEHRGGASFGSDEKLRLIQKNNAEIARRYPTYDTEVQRFIANDPLSTARLALGIAHAGVSGDQHVPVYLAHSLGGGAENYLEHRIKRDLENNLPSVVLRIGGRKRWTLELHSEQAVTSATTENFSVIARLLEGLPRKLITYSCGVGDSEPGTLPEFLVSLKGPEDRITVLFHDFFPITPSYCLLSAADFFDGVPGADNKDAAHQKGRGHGGQVMTLKDWRGAWGHLLDNADTVIAFSNDSAKHIAKAFPDAANRIETQPHTLWQNVAAIQPETISGRTIAVLGNIGLQKGARVIADMAKLIEPNRGEKLMILGNIDPAISLDQSVHVHGDYQIEDLPALVHRYGISCWLIPSIWPETFSYTTHEALATGLPVFVFDLGAQAEAAKAKPNGVVVALDSPTGLAHTMLDAVRETAGDTQCRNK